MVGIRTDEVYKHPSDEVADAEPTEEGIHPVTDIDPLRTSTAGSFLES
jgi:hypothetical protein